MGGKATHCGTPIRWCLCSHFEPDHFCGGPPSTPFRAPVGCAGYVVTLIWTPFWRSLSTPFRPPRDGRGYVATLILALFGGRVLPYFAPPPPATAGVM